MKKYKNKITAYVIIAIVLAFVFLYGSDAPGHRGWTPEHKEMGTAVQKYGQAKPEKSISDINGLPSASYEENKIKQQDEAAMTPPENIVATEKTAENTQPSDKEQHEALEETSYPADFTKSSEEYSQEQGMVIDGDTGKDKYQTSPVPEGKPIPVEPENAVITDKELTCTLSVSCDTILHNIGWLDSEKTSIVPKDGIIFAEKTVTFYEGESVFNLLVREMKRNKIHLEFENTPIYNSAYIEGIANLYEFDCGELSGWMYKVNDWFPNYGCSRYQLKAGDKVEWVYTCDLGNDVGGNYSARNGN